MDIDKISAGTAEEFNVVIEIPKGSLNKYEFNENTGAFELDFVFENLPFIENYGFIPGTRGADGEALDVFVVTPHPLVQGLVVKCQAIGLLEMIDRGQTDNKIIAVPVIGGPKSNPPTEEELESWFSFYQAVGRQKKKTIEIIGWKEKAYAIEELKRAIK